MKGLVRGMKTSTLNIAKFNVQGLSSRLKQETLSQDLVAYKVDICCLQETKLTNGLDDIRNGSRCICPPPICRHYGLGFVVSRSHVEQIHRYRSISDCVAVRTLHLTVADSAQGAKGSGIRSRYEYAAGCSHQHIRSSVNEMRPG